MLFFDKLTLGKPRRTSEGYMAVRARAARAGVYDYLGREIDPEGKHFAADQVVRVYRPEDEVFNKDSVHSFLLKPITDDHPKNPVTASNWRDNARGVNAGALRDGEFLAFDLVLMDAALIEDVERGKRELSNGYASEISIEDGVTPDGTEYQAVQRFIRGNHIAVVDKGRAGHECRIGDVATCDSIPVDLLERLLGDRQTYSDGNFDDKNSGSRRETSSPGGGGDPTQDGEVRMPHTLIIDGLQVPNVSDEARAAIEKLQGQVTALTDANGKLEAKVADLTSQVSTKDGEIAALNQKVEDAALKPEQLEKLVKDRAELITQAKAVDPQVVTDGKTDAEIRKAVVTTKLGDAAANMDDAAIAGAFAVLSKDVKPAADPVRNALSGAQTIGDAKTEYQASHEKRKAALSDAWRQPAPAPATAEA